MTDASWLQMRPVRANGAGLTLTIGSRGEPHVVTNPQSGGWLTTGRTSSEQKRRAARPSWTASARSTTSASLRRPAPAARRDTAASSRERAGARLDGRRLPGTTPKRAGCGRVRRLLRAVQAIVSRACAGSTRAGPKGQRTVQPSRRPLMFSGGPSYRTRASSQPPLTAPRHERAAGPGSHGRR